MAKTQHSGAKARQRSKPTSGTTFNKTKPVTPTPDATSEGSLHSETTFTSTPHFLLMCGTKYFSMKAPGLLTTTINKADITPEFTHLKNLQDAFGHRTGYGVLPHPLIIHEVKFDEKGNVIGSWEVAPADVPVMSRPELTGWGGNRHNSALAECAEREKRNDDPITSHLSYLTFSPMYSLLMKRYKADLAELNGADPDFYTTLFAARLFYAGVLAGRKEQGHRNVSGDLVLDEPAIEEAR